MSNAVQNRRGRQLSITLALAVLVTGLGALSCGGSSGAPCQPGGDASYLTELPKTLDRFCMVSIQGGAVAAHDGVTPYDLNTPLFSDSAVKYRTVWMPKGTSAAYSATEVFNLPVGTILTKSFGFRDDLRKAAPSIKWIETRVFVRQAAGWKAVSYQWDDVQQTATVAYGGGLVPVSWTDEAGAPVSTGYLIPNGNQCLECHSAREVPEPIGPKARNLNKSFIYQTGVDNQLAHWTAAGLLTGAPADASTAPRLAVWNDATSGTVEVRARAYLEVNCAHCHNPDGFARTTGLFLTTEIGRAHV